ncbi:MlaD family protein [Mycobacteroides chelonae]|uniref:Mce family protein n=1 Tax=Mycobacteroides chelonae TaxID=1774 RepID=A0A1S1M445_MYCCH|nr:MlaD family protein [Mycobacteroides chelonae]OHU53266.1 Mce family protein [Mycobacteroides chelonae]OHU78182.1 Mce family protein [Mycobacteroides chelonae]QQG86633.1 MCE family protein [Mycobacteroides chelonae]QQG91450.1 MCE family protein [Mycobacteroides chelonae]
MSIRGVALRFAIFAAVMVTIAVGVAQTIQRPVAGKLNTYSALFSDVGGLKVGSDVRMFGVAVGKVQAIVLDGGEARVRFSVQRDRPLYVSSTLAIRYQNLVGQRYIEVRQPDSAGNLLPTDSTIGIDRTVGSFDITALFNGLEPMLKEFSPESVNQLAVNALAVLQGDDSRVGATLDAVSKLSHYVSDRQTVIAVLLRNFKDISEQIGGRSAQAGALIQGVADVFDGLQKQFDGLMHAIDVIPPVLGPLNSLLTTIGLTFPNNPDLAHDLRVAFPDLDRAVRGLDHVPGILQALTLALPPRSAEMNFTCSRGPAEMPQMLDVLIAGQRIVVCNG